MSSVSPAVRVSRGTSPTFAYVLPGPTSYVVADARVGNAVRVNTVSAQAEKTGLRMESLLPGNVGAGEGRRTAGDAEALTRSIALVKARRLCFVQAPRERALKESLIVCRRPVHRR